jgi:hypothetical protein
MLQWRSGARIAVLGQGYSNAATSFVQSRADGRSGEQVRASNRAVAEIAAPPGEARCLPFAAFRPKARWGMHRAGESG